MVLSKKMPLNSTSPTRRSVRLWWLSFPPPRRQESPRRQERNRRRSWSDGTSLDQLPPARRRRRYNDTPAASDDGADGGEEAHAEDLPHGANDAIGSSSAAWGAATADWMSLREHVHGNSHPVDRSTSKIARYSLRRSD